MSMHMHINMFIHMSIHMSIRMSTLSIHMSCWAVWNPTQAFPATNEVSNTSYCIISVLNFEATRVKKRSKRNEG